MNLNKTLAVALHRAMWTDMQTELGNYPSPEHRLKFKEAWINEYFPDELVIHNCFLCEYALRTGCSVCPIVWPEGHCTGYNFSYETAPISDILALPEKNKCHADFSDDCMKYVAHDEKAVAYSYYQYREELLSKASGIPAICAIDDHVKKIQEKAVEEYFAKTPGAKLATYDHALAIMEKVSNEKDMETLRKTNMHLADKLNRYKDTLSKESNLDRNRPVGDHIREIVKNAVEFGAVDEHERIMDKIEEMLKK